MEMDQARVSRLITYIRQLRDNTDGRDKKALYLANQQDLLRVTPLEVFEIVYQIWQQGEPAAEILTYLDKAMNVFHRGLSRHVWQKPAPDSFIGTLRRENEAMLHHLERIRELLQSGDVLNSVGTLYRLTEALRPFNSHYLKKENILFPYMEQKMERFNGVAVMWALHDQTRMVLDETLALLKRMESQADCASVSDSDFEIAATFCSDTDNSVEEQTNALGMAFGRLLFAMHGLADKEEWILFPAIIDVFSPAEFAAMLEQSFDYGFPLIEDIPVRFDRSSEKEACPQETFPANAIATDAFFQSDTGNLDWEQLQLVFSALPVDLTVVDEDNKVRFFSKPKDRLFPRSPAIIGRDVSRCHPPDSVHVVEEIIEAFRAGRQNQASFWLMLKGRMILIRYVALRTDDGRYKGVLEVSQDITDIRMLEGQRRLLEWE